MTFKQINHLQVWVNECIYRNDLEGLQSILKDKNVVTVEEEGLRTAVFVGKPEIVEFFLKRNVLITHENLTLTAAKQLEDSRIYDMCINALRKQKLQMIEEENG
jgi:hypothetical protein